ncbi:basic proline-rich protein-like [Choloepus didactylus]|uniref:basic proline-rich protein-like n=1 Tax=Choloepus didactylus TaxID=27675 RepID=UPI00189CF746|nr:basic proline-rich protein-like [Choloepus didactylus]
MKAGQAGKELQGPRSFQHHPSVSPSTLRANKRRNEVHCGLEATQGGGFGAPSPQRGLGFGETSPRPAPAQPSRATKGLAENDRCGGGGWKVSSKPEHRSQERSFPEDTQPGAGSVPSPEDGHGPWKPQAQSGVSRAERLGQIGCRPPSQQGGANRNPRELVASQGPSSRLGLREPGAPKVSLRRTRKLETPPGSGSSPSTPASGIRQVQEFQRARKGAARATQQRRDTGATQTHTEQRANTAVRMTAPTRDGAGDPGTGTGAHTPHTALLNAPRAGAAGLADPDRQGPSLAPSAKQLAPLSQSPPGPQIPGWGPAQGRGRELMWQKRPRPGCDPGPRGHTTGEAWGRAEALLGEDGAPCRHPGGLKGSGHSQGPGFEFRLSRASAASVSSCLWPGGQEAPDGGVYGMEADLVPPPGLDRDPDVWVFHKLLKWESRWSPNPPPGPQSFPAERPRLRCPRQSPLSRQGQGRVGGPGWGCGIRRRGRSVSRGIRVFRAQPASPGRRDPHLLLLLQPRAPIRLPGQTFNPSNAAPQGRGGRLGRGPLVFGEKSLFLETWARLGSAPGDVVPAPRRPHDLAFLLSLPPPAPHPAPSPPQPAGPPSRRGSCLRPFRSERATRMVLGGVEEKAAMKGECRGLRYHRPFLSPEPKRLGNATSRHDAAPQPPPHPWPSHTCYWGPGCVDPGRVRGRPFPGGRPFWKGRGSLRKRARPRAGWTGSAVLHPELAAGSPAAAAPPPACFARGSGARPPPPRGPGQLPAPRRPGAPSPGRIRILGAASARRIPLGRLLSRGGGCRAPQRRATPAHPGKRSPGRAALAKRADTPEFAPLFSAGTGEGKEPRLGRGHRSRAPHSGPPARVTPARAAAAGARRGRGRRPHLPASVAAARHERGGPRVPERRAAAAAASRAAPGAVTATPRDGRAPPARPPPPAPPPAALVGCARRPSPSRQLVCRARRGTGVAAAAGEGAGAGRDVSADTAARSPGRGATDRAAPTRRPPPRRGPRAPRLTGKRYPAAPTFDAPRPEAPPKVSVGATRRALPHPGLF